MRCVPRGRIGQRGREQRRLAGVEIARLLVEVALRCGLGAEEPVAPFGDIEIDLDRAGPRPDLAEDERNRDFDAVSNERSSWPQEKVLGHLHGDRGGASGGTVPPAHDFPEGAPIHTGIGAEGRVLRGDDGGDEDGSDRPERNVLSLVWPGFHEAREHERRKRRRDAIEPDKPRERERQGERDPGEGVRKTAEDRSPASHDIRTWRKLRSAASGTRIFGFDLSGELAAERRQGPPLGALAGGDASRKLSEAGAATQHRGGSHPPTAHERRRRSLIWSDYALRVMMPNDDLLVSPREPRHR